METVSFFLFKNISKRIRHFDVYSAKSGIHSGCLVRISLMSEVSDTENKHPLKDTACSRSVNSRAPYFWRSADMHNVNISFARIILYIELDFS